MNLGSVMLGSENPKQLAQFYTKIFGQPGWNDEKNDWYGFQIGTSGLMIGPHSEVKGRNESPGRIMMNFNTEDVKGEFERIKNLGAEVIAEPYEPEGGKGMLLATFADTDGNYFQLSPPWEE